MYIINPKTAAHVAINLQAIIKCQAHLHICSILKIFLKFQNNNSESLTALLNNLNVSSGIVQIAVDPGLRSL